MVGLVDYILKDTVHTLAYKYIQVGSKAILSNESRIVYTSIEIRTLVVFAILGRSYCRL